MADKLSLKDATQFKKALRKAKQQLDKSIVTTPAPRVWLGDDLGRSDEWRDPDADDSGF